MVEETEERWPKYHAEIPARMGLIKNIEKFDATFFGVPFKQSNFILYFMNFLLGFSIYYWGVYIL